MQLPNFTIMWYDFPCVRVEHYNDSWQFTKLDNRFLPPMLYGVSGTMTPDAGKLNLFFQDRVFPASRDNASQLLAGLQLESYDPAAICLRLYGFCSHDNFWIRFDGINQSMTWKERGNLAWYPWFQSMEDMDQY